MKAIFQKYRKLHIWLLADILALLAFFLLRAHDLHAHPGEGPENSFPNLEKHGLEHVKALALVFQLGIALAKAAQANAVAQGIHVAQMLFPAAVKLLKQK